MIALMLIAMLAGGDQAQSTVAALPPAAPPATGIRISPVRQSGDAAGKTVNLSAPDMLRLAQLAESRGDAATATAIYSALENDPDRRIRSEARFRRAKQLAAEKRYSAAAVLLRRILDDDPGATAVRLQLANLLHVLGDDDAALKQLRAADAAGLPANVARLIDRFSEALRAGRPFGASVEIAFAPDSNINRATRSDTLGTVLGDFQVDAKSKARSGTGLSLQSSAYRRFRLHGDSTAFLVRTSGFANLYRSGQFNDIALDLSAGPEFRLGSSRLNLELGGTRRWFGQKPYTRSARLGLTVTRPLGRRAQLRFSSTAAVIDNQVNDLQDGKDFAGQLALERALSSTTGIVLNAGADRQTAKDPAYATRSWDAGATLWHDLGRMTLAIGAQRRRLTADARLSLFPERRSEHYTRLSLAATFRQIHVHGFAPVLRASLERNRSTVELYDYRRTRMEVGVVRAF